MNKRKGDVHINGINGKMSKMWVKKNKKQQCFF